MSESTRKPRRRRRPRHKTRSKVSGTAAPSKKAGGETTAGGKRDTKSKRSRKSRRPRRSTPVAPREISTSDILLHEYDSQDKEIQALNKNIFIYTYTLRPRSLLESYHAGPAVAERMKFEGREKK